ncbi:MAG: hypothetical protein WB493_04495 [Anaeromyxobacteraceae bacterium]
MNRTNCGKGKSWFEAGCDRCGAHDADRAKDVWFVLLLGAVAMPFLVAANLGR